MNTKNFRESEFECKCGCGTYVENAALMILLEDVSERFNKPVFITSATRCEKHNKSVGGSRNSKHLSGEAADIVVKDVLSSAVYSYLDNSPYSEIIGLGKYGDFTHVDARGYHSRW